MKRIILLIAATLSLTLSSIAGVPITKVDKVEPTDAIFMDMAVTAAKKSISEKGKPCGAVIILNKAWRSTGIPTADKTAELVAFEKSRRQTLKNAVIYTVNEPTTDTYITLCEAGVEAIYFANPREAVIAAGIYPASAYDDSKISPDLIQAPLNCMTDPEAASLIKK